MIELVQLEKAHEEFTKHKARVVVVSVDDPAEAKKTQAELPHLTVVADSGQGLTKAVDVIHAKSAPDGKDTAAPTTLIVDGAGVVRWVHRPSSFMVRQSPAELLAEIDRHVK